MTDNNLVTSYITEHKSTFRKVDEMYICVTWQFILTESGKFSCECTALKAISSEWDLVTASFS